MGPGAAGSSEPLGGSTQTGLACARAGRPESSRQEIRASLVARSDPDMAFSYETSAATRQQAQSLRKKGPAFDVEMTHLKEHRRNELGCVESPGDSTTCVKCLNGEWQSSWLLSAPRHQISIGGSAHARRFPHWAHRFTVRGGKIVRFVGYNTTPFESSTR